MDVKADSFCEFYTLRRSHILDILESHPDLNGRLMEYSKLRKEVQGGHHPRHARSAQRTAQRLWGQ